MAAASGRLGALGVRTRGLHSALSIHFCESCVQSVTGGFQSRRAMIHLFRGGWLLFQNEKGL